MKQEEGESAAEPDTAIGQLPWNRRNQRVDELETWRSKPIQCEIEATSDFCEDNIFLVSPEVFLFLFYKVYGALLLGHYKSILNRVSNAFLKFCDFN